MRFGPDAVKQCWAYMTQVYGSRVAQKKDSDFMSLVSWSLDTMGVMDAGAFLERYSTTIGRTIYIPFTIGDCTTKDLWRQVVTCAHEHQHVLQDAREEWYATRYLVSDDYRARMEAEALRVEMQLDYWRYHEIKHSPKELAAKLKRYACSAAAIKTTEKFLEMSAPVVARGGLMDSVAKEAIHWLHMHTPDVRS